MKKVVFTFLALSSIVISASAQKLEDGIKFLYYERYKSAQSVLEKLGGSASTDAKSIYWYGESLMDNPADVAGVSKAKALYQAALSKGINDPWILVGLGQVDLLSGNDIAAAKQKFDQAITQSSATTKGKFKGQADPDILNAIGRANADGSRAIGDPAYALDKLSQAITMNPKDPDYYINQGLNYLKLSSDKGGDAVTAFQKATEIDPKYAKGFYEIGTIYYNQKNKEAMDEWLGKAATADPTFGPTYYTFFKYYSLKDLSAAQDYLDKYIQNSDQDCAAKSLAVELVYKAKKFDDAITKGKALEAEGCASSNSALYTAYAYRAKGDEATAAKYMTQYFSLTPINNVDFLTAVDATRLFMHTNQPDSALKYYQLGYQTTSNKSIKYVFADSASYLLKDKNLPDEKILWARNTLANASEKNSKVALFQLGSVAEEAGKSTKKEPYFVLADSAFQAFKLKYPDLSLGYESQVVNALNWDTTTTKAVKPINDLIGFYSKDPQKNAQKLVSYHGVLGTYYANNTKDYDNALKEFNAVLAIDPNNEAAKGAVAQINEKVKALNDLKGVEEEQKKHEEEEERIKADSIKAANAAKDTTAH